MRSAWGIALIVALSFTSAAWGAPKGPQEADAKYAEAEKLTASGDLAGACDAYRASDEALPTGRAVFGFADCLDKSGKLLAARERFEEAARRAVRAKKPEIEAYIRKRLDSLAERIPKIIVRGPDAVDVAVTFDGAKVARDHFGVPIEADPGEHKVRATQGERAWDSTFRVAERGSLEVLIPQDLGPAPPDAGPPTAPEPATAPPSPRPPEPSPRRNGGFVFLGAGGVALAAGAVFGALALSKSSAVASACPARHCPPGVDRSSVDADDQATNTFATVSTVGFIAGGVLAATGAVLLLTAKQGEQTATRVPVRASIVPGGVVLQGAF